MVRAWLQCFFLRPLDSTPAKKLHDDITSEMFEGENAIRSFIEPIYILKKCFKQFSERAQFSRKTGEQGESK